jgi:pSer/pThr/pTyr-binding forkhead associated (FHA) protein
MIDLTEAELDLGVLVSRTVRCVDESLRAILDDNISRGHVLLLHHGDVFEAFDLCSTNGTFVGGKRVKRLLLEDGATLALGSGLTLEWRRISSAGR